MLSEHNVDVSTKRPPSHEAASYGKRRMQRQPYLTTCALTTNRPGSVHAPMVGASHLHTFGVCSDHMRTQQRTWLLSSAVVHLGGVRPLHWKQVRKEFSPHPVSNFQRGEEAEGSSKEHFPPPILAPQQPAIRIMTAMEIKDRSGKEKVWAYGGSRMVKNGCGQWVRCTCSTPRPPTAKRV